MEFYRYLRVSLVQVTSLLCVLGFLLGVLNLHFSDKTNYCTMTYMYEYPQFVRIHFKDNVRYPAYGLYAYSEGRWTEKARKMRFDGIPVLYLPGNGGSHMQARSLASVALRKALSNGNEFHFDYFTISYNEELSGLFGGTLHKQVEFAAKSINKILDLYTANKYTKFVPTHVIIIGHSMGGVIATSLLAHPETLNSTKIAITLAAPLEAPALLFDLHYDIFYRNMQNEWNNNVQNIRPYNERKVLISFGNGPRDVLVPSRLTSFNHSYINALTTAVPGVWVSPDHVSIVWCKQLVMAINKYLFSLVDPWKLQIVEDVQIIKENAKHFFEANRAMALDPSTPLKNTTMMADAFWYEDNRRIYQVTRPGVEKMTYLMIRLVGFSQNRFAAIEAVNVNDQDWVFGCNARYTYNVHRYCQQASSLSKLTRWTAAANNFGKRKLATVHLHDLKKKHPDWTHIIVKVSPTRAPITLNVDVNDYASRQVQVTLPSLFFSFGKPRTIIRQTEEESIYYELLLKNFSTLPEAYLLYVEPTMTCNEYHVSAEVHVPWAKNHEYTHFFTHLKRTPMKIRLFKTNPNVTIGEEQTEHVKVTLLLDPRCTFTVSISASWYHSLGQLVRNYTTLLCPYIAGIVILGAGCNIHALWKTGSCMPVHMSLNHTFMKPYYVMGIVTFPFFGILCFPFLWPMVGLDHSSYNGELQWVMTSLLAFPAYMVAMGLVHVAVPSVLGAMAFSSQLDRLIFRIFWGGGTAISERLTNAVRKVPMVLSAVMVAAVPMSCGAASLAIGAAFYAYMISRMFQDFFEDLFYQLGAKIASKLCRFVKRKPKATNAKGEEIKWRNLKELETEGLKPPTRNYTQEARDQDMSNMNFQMMMFTLWMISTLLNLPTLLAWARNFKYETKLHPDPSFHAGIVLSACSGYIWQLDGPRKYLKSYNILSIFIYVIGIYVMVVGPFSLAAVNNAVFVVFCTITIHQYMDYEEIVIDGRNYDGRRLNKFNEVDKCEENEQFIAERRNKLEGRKKIHRKASARNWNYFIQLTSGARQRVRNIIGSDKQDSKDTDKTTDKQMNTNKESNDMNSKDDTKKYNEDIEEGQSSYVEGGSSDGKGKNDFAEAGSRNAEGTCDNDNDQNNSEANEGNGTNNASNIGTDENCDVCDESYIYTMFKNLRDKLSFSE